MPGRSPRGVQQAGDPRLRCPCRRGGRSVPPEREMCGIIGYSGPRACKELLLRGLERLEYRGYDSAGIALLDGRRAETARARSARSRTCARSWAPNGSSATLGIGHTRWATHGGVDRRATRTRSLSNDERFAVVHQRHLRELRRAARGAVAEHGHELSSETDTEVLAHLIADVYDGDLVDAVRARLPAARGALRVPRDVPRRARQDRRRAPRLAAARGRRRRGGDVHRLVHVAAFLQRDAHDPARRRGRDRRDHARTARASGHSPAASRSSARSRWPTGRSRSPRRAATRRSC